MKLIDIPVRSYMFHKLNWYLPFVRWVDLVQEAGSSNYCMELSHERSQDWLLRCWLDRNYITYALLHSNSNINEALEKHDVSEMFTKNEIYSDINLLVFLNKNSHEDDLKT